VFPVVLIIIVMVIFAVIVIELKKTAKPPFLKTN